jgi:hypothetical protein
MHKTIQLGEISILVTRKAIKHVHLSVHPPTGRVTLATPVVARYSNPGICSVRVFCGIQIPELVEMFVLKSRTETDARKKVSVIFVLISRTNFSRNFVRCFSASFRCLSAVNLQLNTGHRLMTKGVKFRDLSAA